MRKKPSPKTSPRPSQPAAMQSTPETAPEPTLPDHGSQFRGSIAGASQANTVTSDANPEEEFSRFDQGPVEMPATSTRDGGE
ncbi:multicopy suppressor of a budding defect, partial [Teratosphaeriaceae sp. CCFEE 6253]